MDYMLKKGEVVTMAAAGAASSFIVRKGRIWLTRPGDQQDYLLSQGDHFPLGSEGKFVMEALDDAVLALEGAEERDCRSTIRLKLAFTPLAEAG